MYERLKEAHLRLKVQNLKSLFSPKTQDTKTNDVSRDKVEGNANYQTHPDSPEARSKQGQSGGSQDETIMEEKIHRKSKTDRNVGAIN